MLNVVLGEAPKDRLGIRRPEPQSGSKLDQFIVLLLDNLPIDLPGQDCLQVGVFAGIAIVRPIEPLLFEVLQTRQQRESQQITEGKSDFTLPMSIDVLFFHIHLGVVAQHPLNHRRDFRRRAGLEL
jgi:hypothetical protein